MQLISNSIDKTLSIGRAIARKLKKGDIICLFGELGSGKTTLIKGIASGLGVLGPEVTSPTFILMREYANGRLPFYHFDLYRIKTAKDILGLGYEEYLYDQGVAAIEWADRLGYLLPKEYLKVELLIKAPKSRLFRFKAFGKRYKELLDKISEDIRH